ncbi:MAG: ABC-F family ATP-binding cassette domain-containing protein [Caldiserica bacterium]|nr:ABC-F family ATP-binding cassette domain-containing protein [Caldisericota bacterium]
MQITCTNLSFSYPNQTTPLFDVVSFSISDGSRLGIIGPNGSGKSTLLGLLIGRLQPASGSISRSPPAPRIALIEMDTGNSWLVMTSALAVRSPLLGTAWSVMQSDSDANSTAEAAAEFAAEGGYAVLADVQRALAGAGLPQELWNHTVASLSVGERLWLHVAEALLARADLLILDEPTSHLDIQKRAELAVMLQDLDLPYVVVSHDRHFLDLVSTQVLELTRGRARLYTGGYTTYMATLKADENHDRDIYAVQTRKVMQLKKAIGRVKGQAGSIEALAYKSSSGFFSHKAAKMEKHAKAMRTRLERSLAEATAAKPFIEKKRNYVLEGSPHGGILVSLVRVTALAGNRTLFRDLSLTIRGGEHWCILGPNGAGKSTLLQIVIGQRQPDTGNVMLSPSVKVGFVPQQIALEHGEDIPIDLVRQTSGIGSEDARMLLGTLGIESDQVFQPMQQLSIGQQKCVFIARLVAARPDLLVIDELEGNLAIDAVMLLEQALLQFTGALVMVTHDVALARAVGQQFVSLDGTGGWSQENLFADGES